MGTVPSAAAQVIVTVIPIVGIVLGSIVAFFYLLWNHKQRMSMIERGMQPARQFDIETFSLLAGLLNLFIGIVLFVFFLVKEGVDYSLLGGLVPLSIGISLIVFFVLKKKTL